MKISELYSIPECDMATAQLLATGKTAGIFQCESQLGSDGCKKSKPQTIEDIADVGAVIRPGTLNYKFSSDNKSATEHFYMRRNKQEEIVYNPKCTEKFLNKTQGIILYQEQTLKMAQELAMFSPAESLALQKGISKKKADVIMELRPKFIEGCINNGLSKEDAEKIYDQIETSNRYSFNKCLAAKTKVRTINGTKHEDKKISDIEIGAKVMGPNQEFFLVKDKIDCGKINCVKITLSCLNKITCSINHKFSSSHGVLPLYEIISHNYSINVAGTGSSIYNNVKIEKIELVGPKHCWDLEIDSEAHLFWADGIYVSNSHAVGYAKLGYVTAYLKAHFLTEFMVGTLRFTDEKIDTAAQVRKIVKECKEFGIDIRPPSILHPYVEFTEEDGIIYFGISNIKGIGPGQAELLIEKAAGCKTWYETLIAIRGLNKTTIINSILCGVFSHFKIPRKKMADDYYNLALLTGKHELAFIDQNSGNYDNLGDLVAAIVNITTKQRKEKVDSILKLVNQPAETLQDNPQDITAAEYSLLGCNVSFNNIDQIDKLGNITIEEYLAGKYMKKYTLVAEIKGAKEHIIKNGNSAGKTMCFLDLVDQTGEMTGTVFAAGYNEFGGYLTIGRCLYFIGTRSNRGDFVIESIKEIK